MQKHLEKITINVFLFYFLSTADTHISKFNIQYIAYLVVLVLVILKQNKVKRKEEII